MNTASHPRMGAREWALMLLLSAVWGSSFFFYKVLVQELPPLTVVMGRVTLAALALNLILASRRSSLRPLLPMAPQFFVLGILNNVVPFILICWGETRVSSGLASILNATTPVFGVLTTHFLTGDERLNWGKAAGVALGFAGVAVLVGPAALHGSSDVLGEIACLLGAFVYSLGGIYGRRFRDIPALTVATGQITAAAIIMLPLAMLVDRPWTLAPPSIGAWEALLAISLLCTAFAYLLFFRILAVAGATNIFLVTFLLPISALALGYFALGETIQPPAYAGVVLIGLGLAAIDGRLWKRLRR
jgi:drug/metabolite transporter (DMT)-like permease